MRRRYPLRGLRFNRVCYWLGESLLSRTGGQWSKKGNGKRKEGCLLDQLLFVHERTKQTLTAKLKILTDAM